MQAADAKGVSLQAYLDTTSGEFLLLQYIHPYSLAVVIASLKCSPDSLFHELILDHFATP